MSFGVVDSEAVQRAQRGDRQAQAAVLQALGPALLALVRRLGDRRDTEDQLHDLFAHLLEVLPRFRLSGPAKLSTWAVTVAHRWLLMRRRKKALQLVPLEDGLGVTDVGPSIHERVSAAELERRLNEALQAIPEERRRAFVLTQLYEQPLEVVAEVEGVAVGTVKSRLHRARAELVLRLGAALDREEGERRASAG
jgi:RNA polymerase sigma-70 factor (ECF subfamily)